MAEGVIIFQIAEPKTVGHIVECVCMQPLGNPVVPDVYGITAISSVLTSTSGCEYLFFRVSDHEITFLGMSGSFCINGCNLISGF
ncbi:MAG: hypothetical protein QXW16_06025 [Saccharolobus sp.]